MRALSELVPAQQPPWQTRTAQGKTTGRVRRFPGAVATVSCSPTGADKPARAWRRGWSHTGEGLARSRLLHFQPSCRTVHGMLPHTALNPAQSHRSFAPTPAGRDPSGHLQTADRATGIESSTRSGEQCGVQGPAERQARGERPMQQAGERADERRPPGQPKHRVRSLDRRQRTGTRRQPGMSG